ncbi:hypothetical protein AS156_30900 [Bradyrhizobium macuxiense]|uniref:Uncharacterized protein n=1 Tax=Bradyrhizobium macuxiense TaxID=1755647 RepID=A0A109K2V9_9BRAD|nr:hypothetical protein [Bradyrhizobium macuxiense]KWV59656.1 hypothetical protein AS156_30900 [Bradyrhizobium macuxiense]
MRDNNEQATTLDAIDFDTYAVPASWNDPSERSFAHVPRITVDHGAQPSYPHHSGRQPDSADAMERDRLAETSRRLPSAEAARRLRLARVLFETRRDQSKRLACFRKEVVEEKIETEIMPMIAWMIGDYLPGDEIPEAVERFVGELWTAISRCKARKPSAHKTVIKKTRK